MNYNYEYFIKKDINILPQLICKYDKICIITDENVYQKCSYKLTNILKFSNILYDIFIAEIGEPTKNSHTKEEIDNFLFEKSYSRKSCLIALGGGVVGDLTGFIASTYMRGINYFQIPTSLLAMVDSSIGGKTGIDNKWGKNLIGSFYLPQKIIIDKTFLETLPEEEFINGMAEIIKIAIVANKKLWKILNDNNLKSIKNIINEVIEISVKTKLKIISSDFCERNNKREILNLGHTLGHVIEHLTYHKHGYCVSMGIIYEMLYQDHNGYIVPFYLQKEIKFCLQKYGLPIKLEKELSKQNMINILKNDKKGNKIILINDIGSPITKNVKPEKLVNNLFKNVIIKNNSIYNNILIEIPSSKSETNRIILLSSLGKGNINIINPLYSDDTMYLIESLRKLGVEIKTYNNHINIEGIEGKFKYNYDTKLFIGNSGTSMRFLTAILGFLAYQKITITGDSYMKKRPIIDLVNSLKEVGVNITSNNGYPPIIIDKNDNLNSKDIFINSNISSQYLSGLLMILPLIKYKQIITNKDIVSEGFVNLTISLMNDFGVNIIIKKNNTITFTTNNNIFINPKEYIINGDATSGSYLLGLSVLLNKNIIITNLGKNNKQSDMKFNKLALDNFGYKMKINKNSTTLIKKNNINLDRILDLDSSDTFLTWVILACFIKGTTTIKNISNQNLKECRRIDIIYQTLKDAKVDIIRKDNDLVIKGNSNYNYKGIYVNCHNDHRLALSMTLFGSLVHGTIISNYSCVNKTYYNFWRDIEKLGIKKESVETTKGNKKQECIILIGMTKAGKTTLGEYFTKKYSNYKFMDTDQIIESIYNKKINEIILSYGFEEFRNIESEIFLTILSDIKHKKVIVSTGGGVIEKEKNRILLQKFSNIIHIFRDIKQIEKLIDNDIWNDKITDVWEKRKNIYHNISTYKFINNGEEKSKDYFCRWLNSILNPIKLNDISFFLCLNVKTINDIKNKIDEITKGIDAIEIRVDLLETIDKIEEEIHILGRYTELPIIYTCRTEQEGGKFNKDNYKEIIEIGIKNGVSIIDVELYKKCKINKRHALIIGSCHYDKWNYLVKNFKHGLLHHDIDILKLVGPNELFNRSKKLADQLFKKKKIIIAKGDKGKISRVNNLFMTPVTHPSLNITAKGQLNVNEIVQIRKILFKKNYYLIGKNIQNSPSPFIHNFVFSKNNLTNEYKLFDTNNELDIKNLLNNPDFLGASVTIPYKESIIKYLNDLDDDSKKIKAVNTIIKKGNKLLGSNTDWVALYNIINNTNGSGIIIGSGGAARAACYAMLKANIKFDIICRNNIKGLELINEFNGNKCYSMDYDISSLKPKIVIICIPSEINLNLNNLLSETIIIDMGYKNKRGRTTINGYYVLAKQAELQYELWCDKKTDLYLEGIEKYIKG
jgi:pentafunctional AROM polypeptide